MHSINKRSLSAVIELGKTRLQRFEKSLVHVIHFHCYFNNFCSNWRARKTLSGVTQLKIGDICLYICLTYVCIFVL